MTQATEVTELVQAKPRYDGAWRRMRSQAIWGGPCMALFSMVQVLDYATPREVALLAPTFIAISVLGLWALLSEKAAIAYYLQAAAVFAIATNATIIITNWNTLATRDGAWLPASIASFIIGLVGLHLIASAAAVNRSSNQPGEAPGR